MNDEQIEDAEIITDQAPPLRDREPREIVPFVAGGALAAMIPQTPEEYGRLANMLGLAGCVPASYSGGTVEETRAKLIIGLMKSVEIGVPPITGLNGIMIVNNRPSVWGDLGISLIQRSGQLAKMEVHEVGPHPQPHDLPLMEWQGEFGYRVMMWRRGQETPYVGEFRVGDAKRAGLWLNTKKDPWIKYPKDMLFNRARAKACRMGFADALHGMGIVEEERDWAPDPEAARTPSLADDEPVTVLPATPAPERAEIEAEGQEGGQ